MRTKKNSQKARATARTAAKLEDREGALEVYAERIESLRVRVEAARQNLEAEALRARADGGDLIAIIRAEGRLAALEEALELFSPAERILLDKPPAAV